MKKMNVIKALFAAAALAFVLPGCGDISEETTAQTQVTKDGKVAVSLSVREDFRSIISAVSTVDLAYSLTITDTLESTEEGYEAPQTIALSNLTGTVAYLTADKTYKFTLTGYAKDSEGNATETAIIATRSAVQKKITASDATVSLTLKAVEGSTVQVSLTVNYTTGYGVSDVTATVYDDSVLTTVSDTAKNVLALSNENARNNDKTDGNVEFTGTIATGSTKWVKITLNDGTKDIGSKTVALYGIPTGDLAGTETVAVKEYKATVNLTADTKPESLTLKNKAISATDYTGVTLTTESTDKPYVFTGYVPVGEYDVYNAGTVIGQVTGTDALTVNTSVTLNSITAAWTDAQPVLYAGADGNSDAIKAALTVTATYSNDTEESVSNYTISGFDNTKTDEQPITVSYTYNGVTKTTTINVTLTAVALESIAVDESSVLKKEYTVGDELDLTGLVLALTYNDTSKNTTVEYSDENKDDFGVSGFNSSDPAESQTVTITYGGKTTTFDVVIKKAGAILYKYGTSVAGVDYSAGYSVIGSGEYLIYPVALTSSDSAIIKAKITTTAKDASVGVGFVAFEDGAYSDGKIKEYAFVTPQKVFYQNIEKTNSQGWGKDSGYSTEAGEFELEGKLYINNSIQYIDWSSTDSNSKTAVKNGTKTGSGQTYFTGSKKFYIAIGGANAISQGSIKLSDISITIGTGDNAETLEVGSLADLSADTRTAIAASTTDLSYEIPSTVADSNKGDSYEITLANVSLASVKAMADSTEVAGTWAWDVAKVTLATGTSSVKAKATFTPTDTATYKLISSQEFTIAVTDNRAEKPEDATVNVTWNFASAASLSAYTTATADTTNNTVTYSDPVAYGTANTYLVSTSRSMGLKIVGTYRDNGNSAQISGDIYVPVSAGSVLTIVPFNNASYVNYTVTLNGDKTTGEITSTETTSYTAKTAGFAKISTTQYLISVAVTNLTREDVIGYYGAETEHIATFPTAAEPTVSISGEDSVAAEETITLTATTENFGEGITPTITWSTGDETIATVSSSGVVTGVKAGSAVITATATYGTGDDKLEATATVTITVGAAKAYVKAGKYNLTTKAKEGFIVDGSEGGKWNSQDDGNTQTHDNIIITAKIDSSGANLKNSGGTVSFELKEAMKLTFADSNSKGTKITTTDGMITSDDTNVTVASDGKSATTAENSTVVKLVLAKGSYVLRGNTGSSAKVATLTFEPISTTPDPNTTVSVDSGISSDITLTADANVFTVAGAPVTASDSTIAWLVDGVAVEGETAATFTLSGKTVGKWYDVTAKVTDAGGVVYTKTTSVLYIGN